VTQAVAPVAQAVAPVVQAVAPAIQAPPAAASSVPAGAPAGGAGSAGVPRTAESVAPASASAPAATTVSPRVAAAPATSTVAPQANGAVKEATPSAPTTTRQSRRTVLTSTHGPDQINGGAHRASMTQPAAGGAAASVTGLRNGAQPRHGLNGTARTADRAPAAPVAPLPGGIGFGNGGEAAAGAGAGGVSGAAEACSQTVVNVQSVTLALQAFARSRAPEPLLLLPKRPG